MWCKTCQQDVPAVVAEGQSGVCCVRCGEPIDGSEVPAGDASGSEGLDTMADGLSTEHTATAPPPGDLDNWELGEQLRHVEHVLQRSATSSLQSTDHETSVRRMDAAHQSMIHWHIERNASSAYPALRRTRTSSERVKPRPSLLAWGTIMMGVAVFSCGLALLVWSQLTGRANLWSLGMPIALAGQLGLVLGLILGLEHTSQSQRELAKRFDEATGQLNDLRQSAPPAEKLPSVSETFAPLFAHGAGSDAASRRGRSRR